MKRIFLLIGMCHLGLFFLFPTIGQAKPEVSVNNAILIDQNSGRVLFEKRAHERKPIASITKVMTAIIAIESGQMDESARTSKKAIYTEGSSIYLKKGEKMTINDLVYGLMLRSGNDAAVSISEHVGGSVEGLVYLMNEKARWLGMTDTHFINPHGLGDEDHYSSAYDMAILMRYAMENDEFKKITGAKSYKAENRVYAWQNKNKLLTTYYDHCIGGKTGFTRESGRTLVTAAKKEDMELVAVTLNAGDDWRDHSSLYDRGFNHYSNKKLAEKGKHKYQTDDMTEPITGFLKDDFYLPLSKSEKVTNQTVIDSQAIKEKQSRIGMTTYYINDVREKNIPIYSIEKEDNNESFLQLLNKSVKYIMGI